LQQGLKGILQYRKSIVTDNNNGNVWMIRHRILVITQ
jgi:hypothetical protein